MVNVNACSCRDRNPDRLCAGCGHRNQPGHQRRHHRGFIQLVDEFGPRDMCVVCGLGEMTKAAEFDTTDVTVLIGVHDHSGTMQDQSSSRPRSLG